MAVMPLLANCFLLPYVSIVNTYHAIQTEAGEWVVEWRVGRVRQGMAMPIAVAV